MACFIYGTPERFYMEYFGEFIEISLFDSFLPMPKYDIYRTFFRVP